MKEEEEPAATVVRAKERVDISCSPITPAPLREVEVVRVPRERGVTLRRSYR
jgi:hypothetical protein